MIVSFECFKDDIDDDLLFVIENSNRERKGYIDLCFDVDKTVFGEDE